MYNLKYWCDKHGYPMTEIRVATWWTTRIAEAINKAMRSTNRALQNTMNVEFGWPAITEDSGSMKNPQHKYYSDRQAPIRPKELDQTEPQIVFDRNGRQTIDGKSIEYPNQQKVKSIKPNLIKEGDQKVEKFRFGAKRKNSSSTPPVFLSRDTRYKENPTAEDLIMKGHRMKIIDEGTDLAKKQFEERMQFLEEEKKRLQEEERRREITKREQKDIEEAKMITEGIKISNEDAEERKEKMEEAEGQLKMNLRPRTRSTTSSSYKTEDEDDKDDDSGSDSENDWYPLKSPPTIRREDDNRTEEEITAEYLNEHYSSPGGNLIDPSSNEEPETENMDTAEIPRENIFSNDDIHIRRVPLKVYNQKGMNMTKTVNTVLENNKGMNLERYFRNLMITMTRAEQGIDADKQNGKLDNSTKIAQARRYKAARLAPEHTWKGEDSEDYFNKRKEKAAQREREQKKKKTQKYRSSTPTDKTKENLNKTVDLVSPDRDAKREQKSKKRGHDDLDFDTDYCSDNDKVPSECDEDTKIVIRKKNKKLG